MTMIRVSQAEAKCGIIFLLEVFREILASLRV